MYAALDATNDEYYIKMRKENVDFSEYPKEVLNWLKLLAKEVIKQRTEDDLRIKKVCKSYGIFHKEIGGWSEISE